MIDINDKVIVISGDYKGKVGKVVKQINDYAYVLLENVKSVKTIHRGKRYMSKALETDGLKIRLSNLANYSNDNLRKTQ